MGNPASRFVWYELATTDIEAAKAFYAGVVGWRAADAAIPGSKYTLFTAARTPVAGAVQMLADASRAGAAPQWIGYAGVEDVDAAAARAERLGGTVHVRPADLPGASRFSIVADPQMAILGLIEGGGRGQGAAPLPGGNGRVAWHELLASGWEEAFAFYSALLGWKKADALNSALGTYQQFSAGTETIGGMFTKPEMLPFPFWLYYFSVPDIEPAIKRVNAGGGRVLFGPIAVQSGARTVQCQDPQGAVFGLSDSGLRISVGCYSPRSQAQR